MPQVADDVASLIEKLTQRIIALEARVSALEYASSVSPALSASSSNIQVLSTTASLRADFGRTGNAITVLGKAVLAMAGAYLLRAVAESSPRGQFPMLIAAILYSAGWMAWAVRAHRTNHLASMAYGTTATLILSPLLYEATVKFQLLSVESTSGVIVAFVVMVLVLALHRNLQVLPWVGTLGSIATLWALILATHELIPLTCALLAIAFAVEVAACLGHRPSLWAIVAVAADAAVALFVYVMTLPEGVPSSYTPASRTAIALLSLSLLVIYGGGIAIRSFGAQKRIANSEVLQGVLVFVLAYAGAIRASHRIAPTLGILFLALALVCYWGALFRFLGSGNTRNRSISASWAVTLMLSGLVIVSSPVTGTLVSCLLTIGAVFLHRRNGSLSLAVHASLYLGLAAVLSSSLSYAHEAFAGAMPASPHWTVWMVLISAFLCYSLLQPLLEVPWNRALLWIPSAALVSALIASFAVVAVYAVMATRLELGASHVAGIRTAVICLAALILRLIASRMERAELSWLAYTAVGLGAFKLLFEDLRFGNPTSLVVSMLFYGLILVILPRLPRTSGSRPTTEVRTMSAPKAD